MVRAKKYLGQHFLTSSAICDALVAAASVTADDTVLEIGPGKGALTARLLATGARIIAIEKDTELLPILKENFTKEISTGQLLLQGGDVLTDTIVLPNSYKLVANIPYYISGEILRIFLANDAPPTHISLLMQKEIVERIARDVKSSILSLSVRAYGTPTYIQKVSARYFSPKPKVDSAILLVTDISKNFFNTITEELFFDVVHAGFAHKRKKLIRNLESVAEKNKLEKIFKELGLEENVRAEELGINIWKQVVEGVYASNEL